MEFEIAPLLSEPPDAGDVLALGKGAFL